MGIPTKFWTTRIRTTKLLNSVSPLLFRASIISRAAVLAPAKMGAPAIAMSWPIRKGATKTIRPTPAMTPTRLMTTVFHWRFSSGKSIMVPREVIRIPIRLLAMAVTAAVSKMSPGSPHQNAIRSVTAMTRVADRTARVFSATISPKAKMAIRIANAIVGVI